MFDLRCCKCNRIYVNMQAYIRLFLIELTIINVYAYIAMISLNEKIREIISYFKMSDRQFALKIGVSQSVIGSMFQKGTEPSAKVIRNTLMTFQEISADWFIRDEGEMIKNPNKELERINKLVDTIATLQETINAKSETIAALNERIKQLESKLK